MARPKVITREFTRWLNELIFSHKVSVYRIANELHVSPRTIYRHMMGENAPSFPMIISYCWFFNKKYGTKEDPLEVFDLLEVE